MGSRYGLSMDRSGAYRKSKSRVSHKEERGMNGTGRIALVTGAGTGIGKRTSLMLLEAGYSVVLAGRRLEPLQQTVHEAGVPDTRTLVMSTDVSDPQAVSALFAATEAKFGRLDVLFNN